MIYKYTTNVSQSSVPASATMSSWCNYLSLLLCSSTICLALADKLKVSKEPVLTIHATSPIIDNTATAEIERSGYAGGGHGSGGGGYGGGGHGGGQSCNKEIPNLIYN